VYPLRGLNAVFCRIAALVLTVLAVASCRTAGVDTRPRTEPRAADEPRPPIIQPGAPGEASHVISAEKASDLSQVQYIGADIKFMQGMIGHHAQAVEMVALVPSRTSIEDMKKLALRIDLSQQDEIKMMQQWLTARSQQVPSPGAHRMGGATLMPGMLTEEEMARLAAAKGAEFDRLFLEGMIKHHFGALTMVQELFATAGAGQDPEIFAYVSDVDADQRMEIDRMGAMLNAIVKE
jgi:uncharacterized protein (DUF305 family)